MSNWIIVHDLILPEECLNVWIQEYWILQGMLKNHWERCVTSWNVVKIEIFIIFFIFMLHKVLFSIHISYLYYVLLFTYYIFICTFIWYITSLVSQKFVIHKILNALKSFWFFVHSSSGLIFLSWHLPFFYLKNKNFLRIKILFHVYNALIMKTI